MRARGELKTIRRRHPGHLFRFAEAWGAVQKQCRDSRFAIRGSNTAGALFCRYTQCDVAVAGTSLFRSVVGDWLFLAIALGLHAIYRNSAA